MSEALSHPHLIMLYTVPKDHWPHYPASHHQKLAVHSCRYVLDVPDILSAPEALWSMPCSLVMLLRVGSLPPAAADSSIPRASPATGVPSAIVPLDEHLPAQMQLRFVNASAQGALSLENVSGHQLLSQPLAQLLPDIHDSILLQVQ